MRFPLGTITVTHAAATALRITDTHLLDLLTRHGVGDSGASQESDAETGIEQGKEVFSCYPLPGTGLMLCVSTRADRGATFVLLSGEAHDAL